MQFEAPGRMVITPLDRRFPPLLLDHAVDGGTHALTPADPVAERILRDNGCS